MTQEIQQRIDQIEKGQVPTGYKQTKVGIVPSDWVFIKLGEIADIYDGTHQTPNYIESGVPFVSVENIGDMLKTTKFISAEDFEKYKIKPIINDILMTRITAGIIGNTEIVRDNRPLAYYVSLALIRIINENNIEYINLFINSYIFKKELNMRIIHTAFPKKINLGDINQCNCIVPPLKEQEKIAEILTTQDKVIELKQNLIEEKEMQKKYLMQNLLTGKVRLSGFSDDWKTVKLKDVLEETKLKNTDENLLICSVSVKKGVVNQVEHLGRSYAANDCSNYNLVKYGDIIYTKSPTGKFPYGIIKQSFMKDNVAVSPLYGVYKPISFSLGNILNYYFESNLNVFNYLHSIIQKGAKNTINITNSNFLSNYLFLPLNLDEQNAIAEILTTSDKEIELLKQDLELEKQKKKSLMQLLLTGIVRV